MTGLHNSCYKLYLVEIVKVETTLDLKNGQSVHRFLGSFGILLGPVYYRTGLPIPVGLAGLHNFA